MKPRDIHDAQRWLGALGFPCGSPDGVAGRLTRSAVARFQIAYNLTDWLAVDGVLGPNTHKALKTAITHTHGPRLSQHFSVRECRSKGDGTAYVHRELLARLEKLRAAVGKPVPLISSWRDPAHNRRVGGARRSQHTYGAATRLHRLVLDHPYAGRAADLPRGLITYDRARELGLFGGLGVTSPRMPWVTHVDARAGSRSSPATWYYNT